MRTGGRDRFGPPINGLPGFGDRLMNRGQALPPLSPNYGVKASESLRF
jgi:hypothetical protein